MLELLIRCKMKTSLVSSVHAIVCFYKEEIIIVKLDRQKKKEIKQEIKNDMIAKGTSKFKLFFVGLVAVSYYVDKLQETKADELKLKGAKSISKFEIKSLKFTRATENYDVESDSRTYNNGKLIIKTETEKFKFIHKYRDFKNEMRGYINTYLK